jgi:uncharacterized protein
VKIIDGNILIYAVNRRAAHHTKCREWLQSALSGQEEIGFNWIAINAFLRISTQTRVFSEPLTVAEAIRHVQQWLDAPLARLVEPMPDHWLALKDLLLAVGVGGNLTTDAHLAALAISHNATLVSCDNDFARFRRLKWENPLAVP